MGLWLSFSFTCSTKLKNARGKLAEGRFGIYSAARRSWPFGFRPVALRRRLSAGLPFRYGTFSCKGTVSYFGWQNKNASEQISRRHSKIEFGNSAIMAFRL
jgi:hypothetical protein